MKISVNFIYIAMKQFLECRNWNSNYNRFVWCFVLVRNFFDCLSVVVSKFQLKENLNNYNTIHLF